MATPRSAFIFGLWGDSTIPRWPKARQDFAKFACATKPKPYRVYVYGVDNHQHCVDCGLDPILMDSRGSIAPSGGNMWWHKLHIIGRALTEFDEIIWLDSDVRLTSMLPDDFWSWMRSRQPVQANLYHYSRPRGLRWRPAPTHARRRFWGQYYMPGGAFIYIRGRDVFDEIMDIGSKEFGEWRGDDEMILARYTDHLGRLSWEQKGEWKRYKLIGFEPECCSFRMKAWEPKLSLFSINRK